MRAPHGIGRCSTRNAPTLSLFHECDRTVTRPQQPRQSRCAAERCMLIARSEANAFTPLIGARVARATDANPLTCVRRFSGTLRIPPCTGDAYCEAQRQCCERCRNRKTNARVRLMTISFIDRLKMPTSAADFRPPNRRSVFSTLRRNDHLRERFRLSRHRDRRAVPAACRRMRTDLFQSGSSASAPGTKRRNRTRGGDASRAQDAVNGRPGQNSVQATCRQCS